MAPVDPQPPVAAGPTLLDRLKDMAERAVATFAEQFLGLLVLTGVGSIAGVQTAAAAGVATGLIVVKNVVTSLSNSTNSSNIYADVLLRTFFTYAAGFLGLVLTNGGVDYSNAKMAAVAAVPAALAVVKGFIGQFLGNRNTAAWLPATVAVPPPTEALALVA